MFSYCQLPVYLLSYLILIGEVLYTKLRSEFGPGSVDSFSLILKKETNEEGFIEKREILNEENLNRHQVHTGVSGY